MANGDPYGAAIDNGVRRAGAAGIYEEEKPKLKSYECMHTLTGLACWHSPVMLWLQISHIESPAQMAGFKKLYNAQKYGQKKCQ